MLWCKGASKFHTNEKKKRMNTRENLSIAANFAAAFDFENAKIDKNIARCSMFASCSYVCLFVSFFFSFSLASFGLLHFKMHALSNRRVRTTNDRFGSWLFQVLFQFSYGFRMTPMCVCVNSCMYSYRAIECVEHVAILLCPTWKWVRLHCLPNRTGRKCVSLSLCCCFFRFCLHSIHRTLYGSLAIMFYQTNKNH